MNHAYLYYIALTVSPVLLIGACSQQDVPLRGANHSELKDGAQSDSRPTGTDDQSSTNSASDGANPNTQNSANPGDNDASPTVIAPIVPPPTDLGPAITATGSVAVSFNLLPPTPAGNYRNQGHVRAIWITDAQNRHVKTLQTFAATRTANLRRWQAITAKVPDGVSGATQKTVAAGMPINLTWDLKDKAGTAMNTGSYRLWLEFTEANTPALDPAKLPADPMQPPDNTNGYEYLITPFTVSAQGAQQTNGTNAVFKDVLIKHSP